MGSLIESSLVREIEADRLRMAGYQSRVTRRRRESREVLGNALIAVGERVRGCAQVSPAVRQA